MKLYHAGKDGSFKGIVSDAHKNPMYSEDTHAIEDEHLYNPRTSSLKKPPDCDPGQCAVLVDGKWTKAVNLVGQHYYRPDGARVDIVKIGIDIPAGCIQDDPPSEFHRTHDGSTWLLDQDAKDDCDNEITRVAEIDSEKENSGLKRIAFRDAKNFVENRIDSAADLDELKSAIKEILNKMIPFII